MAQLKPRVGSVVRALEDAYGWKSGYGTTREVIGKIINIKYDFSYEGQILPISYTIACIVPSGSIWHNTIKVELLHYWVKP